MAQGAMRPCSKPGCPELVGSGRCPRHTVAQHQDDRSRRGSSNDRGYTSRWRRYAQDYLAQHQLCRECGEYARCVDHVIPWRRGKTSIEREQLFWDPSNHQALCASCHSRKTATEDGGWGNPTIPITRSGVVGDTRNVYVPDHTRIRNDRPHRLSFADPTNSTLTEV